MVRVLLEPSRSERVPPKREHRVIAYDALKCGLRAGQVIKAGGGFRSRRWGKRQRGEVREKPRALDGAGLPGGHHAVGHSRPDFAHEHLSVVRPDGIDDAKRPGRAPGGEKSVNVFEAALEVRRNLVPTCDAC